MLLCLPLRQLLKKYIYLLGGGGGGGDSRALDPLYEALVSVFSYCQIHFNN